MEIEQALCCKRIDLLERIPKSNWHSHAGKGANVDFLNSEYNTIIPQSNLKSDSIEEMQRWFSKSRGSLNSTPGKMCKIWRGVLLKQKEITIIAWCRVSLWSLFWMWVVWIPL